LKNVYTTKQTEIKFEFTKEVIEKAVHKIDDFLDCYKTINHKENWMGFLLSDIGIYLFQNKKAQPLKDCALAMVRIRLE